MEMRDDLDLLVVEKMAVIEFFPTDGRRWWLANRRSIEGEGNIAWFTDHGSRCCGGGWFWWSCWRERIGGAVDDLVEFVVTLVDGRS